jgi:FixJ family two-component response regulator
VAIDALRDNTQTPPPDQAAFRIDIPAWLAKLTEKKRGIVTDLMHGEGTKETAANHGVSPARVSQIRRKPTTIWRSTSGGGAASP